MIEPRGSVTNTEDTRVTDEQARKTVLMVAGVLIVLMAWNLHRGRITVVNVLGCIGTALLFNALFFPASARSFHTAWMRLASALGYVNSRVLLTLMYYLVLTPYGFVMRLAGRDVLRRRGKTQESYWVPRKTTRQAREQFERLF